MFCFDLAQLLLTNKRFLLQVFFPSFISAYDSHYFHTYLILILNYIIMIILLLQTKSYPRTCISISSVLFIISVTQVSVMKFIAELKLYNSFKSN